MATPAEAFAIALEHHQSGRLVEAQRALQQILAVEPDHVDALHLSGLIASRQGRYEDAARSITRAIALNANVPAFHSNLSVAFKALGKLDEAVACCRRALELKPDYAVAHFNLGNAVQAQGKLNEAAESYRRALQLIPDYAAAHLNLGIALQTLGKLDEAVDAYRLALSQQPSQPTAWFNLAAALQAQDKLTEAVPAYRQAVQLQPENVEAHTNLAVALIQLGKGNEAISCLLRALELEPDCVEAHNDLSLLLLLQGDFERGWPELEWRWKSSEIIERKFSQPRWNGEPLAGKTILLHTEQGLGDTIQFIRYARTVKEANPEATVVVECEPPLVNLLRSCRGIDRLLAEGEELPAFDVHASLLSLPGILGTRLDTIPAPVPYLFADEGLAAEWGTRLEAMGTARPTQTSAVSGLRVGINWQGRPGKGEWRKRDVPVEYLAQLADTPGISLISLQKGEAPSNVQCPKSNVGEIDAAILDVGELDTQRGAFVDTAAIMMNLDLVVTSDTSVAHLAGALGVPVWVALPFAPDWRWLLERSDSPWYPTMRLFRQKKLGDWAGVFEEIRAALAERVQRSAFKIQS